MGKVFAARQGPGIVLAAVKVDKSARDLEPIAKALAPEYRHQQEVTFLRGSQFRLTGEGKIQVRSGSARVFSLEEAS